MGFLNRRRVLGVVIALLLVSGVVSAYMRQGAQVVTVDAAVRAFRSSAAATASTAPSAASVATPTTGSDGPTTTAAAPAADLAASRSKSPSPSAATSSASAGSTRAAAPAPAAQQAKPGVFGADAPDGVYVFATEGYEETNAVGGARHDYPRETAMTMRHIECGYLIHWQPLAERWDENELCREPEGFAVRRFSMYHEFFQQGQRQDFLCPQGSLVSRYAPTPGQTWTWSCKTDTSGVFTNVTYLGEETLDIGGTAVRTARYSYASTLTGANRGTQKQERWLALDTGINVRIDSNVDTEADSPFGAVHYEEHYKIVLTSLTPRR